MKFITNSNDLSKYLDTPIKKNIQIKDISIDSRTIKKDSLFIAINGENFNGNDYVDEAIHKGACLVITDSKKYKTSKNKNIIYVNNSISALKKITSNILKSFDGNVVGITGSNGKTTTTKIIANVLSKSSSTLNNYNNEIGMPLSIFNAKQNSKNLVIEMGAAKPGDIKYLSSILKPNIGVITNIGNSHLEKLKNIKGVLKVKSELVSNIKNGGYLVVPNENKEHLKFWEKIIRGKELITFGTEKNADFYAINIKSSIKKQEFNIISDKYNIDHKIKTSLSGVHNIKNILAAFAVSYLIENSPKLFNQRLEKNTQVRQKQQKWIRGSLLIDDTYNANPESVKKAIDFLSNSNKRKVFIMGDMLELGRYRKKMHADVGQYAKRKKVDVFLGFGELTKYAVSGYGKNGLFFNNENDLKKFIKENIKSGDIVLIKGSRGIKMERFINV
ncbi:MAG: UDP-N-acetylmuramoyl-tripeptide--D-alanyl-D-alanine ligase [Proteobacteria bacterium]|jgi:UDP-N-acetylmuramoyl-tripeptide--D-alanyl-D-alanine ligase|nr:UDP-N-acetylmuramoyl-tripeptide--D-alanyl-D-alanine ligase [Pseudomonadota bacterium]NCX41643.1 UDP-N-acetylmuramoyl-tripeptide--D-alanyl-D-alanine ligase [Pseudomonadota bacterium]